MTKRKKSSRGGRREGAGRKAGPGGKKVPLATKLLPAVREYLAYAGAAATIESLVVRSYGFKKWELARCHAPN